MLIAAARAVRMPDMDIEALTRVATRAELVAAGYVDAEIAAAVRRGGLRPIARGVYAPASIADLTTEQRYPHVVHAHAKSMPAGRAVASVSAAALYGLPLWGLDIRAVHSVESGGGSGTRSTRSAVLHRDHRPPAAIDLHGIAVTTPARTVVDVARRAGRDAAVSTGDAALHGRLCTPDDLRRELALIDGTPGCIAARRAVRLMDGRSESVLESRSRLAFVDAGLQMPIPQYEIYDERGEFVARVDFAWPELRVFAEADGEEKYVGDTRAILAREKYRHDRVVDLGWRGVRWGWADLENGLLVPRIERVLEAAGRDRV